MCSTSSWCRGPTFGKDGSRIGYGGGFYDAYLERASQAWRVR